MTLALPEAPVLAAYGLQGVLGVVGLLAGATKVTGQQSQVETFERFGYSRRIRLFTGVAEVVAGTALLAGVVAPPTVTLLGAAVFAVVLAGAVVSHARMDDPASELAVPAVLLLLAVTVAVIRFRGGL